jgi:hypothetical protein
LQAAFLYFTKMAIFALWRQAAGFLQKMAVFVIMILKFKEIQSLYMGKLASPVPWRACRLPCLAAHPLASLSALMSNALHCPLAAAAGCCPEPLAVLLSRQLPPGILCSACLCLAGSQGRGGTVKCRPLPD